MIDLEKSVLDTLKKAGKPLTMGEIFALNKDLDGKRDLIQLLLELSADLLIESALFDGVRKYAASGILDLAQTEAVPIAQNPVLAANIKAVAQINNNIAEKTSKPESIAISLIKYIEKNPACTMADMKTHVAASAEKNHIKTYINKGLIVVGKNSAGKATHTLKNGLTVEDLLASRFNRAPYNINQSAKTSEFECPVFIGNSTKFIKDAPAQAEQKTPLANSALPSCAPLLALYYAGSLKDAVDFKLAYTSEKTLILFGINANPVELTPAQTSKLMEFVEEHC